MTMKRSRDTWIKADEFGRSIPRGIGTSLLVPKNGPVEQFCRLVLGATTIYSDEDFAVITLLGSIFMLHADHACTGHELSGALRGTETRGAGMEIRLYGADPDHVEANARARDHIVLAGSLDKPHGLRESHVVGPNGYVFVPCQAIVED